MLHGLHLNKTMIATDDIASYVDSCIKPEPNMLKVYQLFFPVLLKKFTHCSYFILISLPIIPILFFLFYCFVY